MKRLGIVAALALALSWAGSAAAAKPQPFAVLTAGGICPVVSDQSFPDRDHPFRWAG